MWGKKMQEILEVGAYKRLNLCSALLDIAVAEK